MGHLLMFFLELGKHEYTVSDDGKEHTFTVEIVDSVEDYLKVLKVYSTEYEKS